MLYTPIQAMKNKVRDALLERIERLEMSESFGEIMVPC
ncbi:MAG: hypothetical protein Ct9H90mP4_07310 [Gammaproteobacteria bacterium]|nr:MAG: hypothetical protein Ct9H90mP4_07310 [Gammaproteobacteria bacterium]